MTRHAEDIESDRRYEAAKANWEARNAHRLPMVKCSDCGERFPSSGGAKMCDPCWETYTSCLCRGCGDVELSEPGYCAECRVTYADDMVSP